MSSINSGLKVFKRTEVFFILFDAYSLLFLLKILRITADKIITIPFNRWGKKETQLMKKKFIIEQLEERLMLSADFLPVPFDAGLPHDEITADFSVVESPLIPTALSSDNVVNADLQHHEPLYR